MRAIILFAFLLVGNFTIGQTNYDKIDTSNYYNYYSNGENIKGKVLTTEWLQLIDVAPVIMEELINAGYEWLNDFALYKIDSGKYVILVSYSRKSNFGFLYIQGHNAIPDKENRKELTEKKEKGVDYIVCEETPKGEANFIKIENIPKNIFVLNENCYWYQYTKNPDDNNNLVTKEIAIKILKQDIRDRLAKVPNL